MKNRKLIIIAIFMMLLVAISVIDTYALFETNAASSKNLSIGKWNILLNGENVKQSRTININDFVYTNGEHTQSNYFAPGSSLYFDIEIDATDTDVSFEYSLDIDDSVIENHDNINFSITNLDTNEVINDTSYSDIILLNDEDRTITLRINLVWNDDEDYDLEDNKLIGEDLEFVIDTIFKQYLGE